MDRLQYVFDHVNFDEALIYVRERVSQYALEAAKYESRLIPSDLAAKLGKDAIRRMIDTSFLTEPFGVDPVVKAGEQHFAVDQFWGVFWDECSARAEGRHPSEFGNFYCAELASYLSEAASAAELWACIAMAMTFSADFDFPYNELFMSEEDLLHNKKARTKGEQIFDKVTETMSLGLETKDSAIKKVAEERGEDYDNVRRLYFLQQKKSFNTKGK
jgi:hypothetical protein